MKHLATPILEFVLAQPAHKLPVVFTLEECPLPDCSEAPEDVLGEALRLQKEGWIEANVTRGVAGKPKQVEVRYITLPGRNYLESRNTRGKENNPARGLIRLIRLISWGVAGLVVLILVLLWAFGRHAISPREVQHAPAVSELQGDTSALTSVPTPSPEPSATPDVSTSPVLAHSPTAARTPQPVASPSPSPHRKRVQR